MTDNIIDFTSRLKEKKEQVDLEDNDTIQDICTETANELLNDLDEYYGLDLHKVEHGAEMIFFFEAYKALLMKCVDQWHPFQDVAADFMAQQKIVVEEHEGGYRFVIGDEEPEDPANDE
jgi:hypothetical protein